MFFKVKGGKFNRPVKVDSVHIASAVINRIAPQGSHRYSRRGHNTIVLHPSFSSFNILSKMSLNDRATGGGALLINKSYLFSEVHLNTLLQAVAVRMTLNKVVTFCSIYLPPSDYVAKTDLINLICHLRSFFWATSTVTPRFGVTSPITAEDKCWRTSSQKWIYVI